MRAVLARVFQQPWSLGGYWFYRVLAAWLIAAPLVGAFSGIAMGRLPTGDTVLFEPGGLFLAEAARLAGPQLGAQARGMSLTALVLGYLGLVPLAVLLLGLRADQNSRPRERVGSAIARLPGLSLLLGLTLIAQLVVLVIGALAVPAAANGFGRVFDARGADLGSAFLATVFGAALALVGISHDVGRTVLVCQDARFKVALRSALSVMFRRGPRLFLVWLAGATVGCLLVVAAALVTSRLAVERPDAWRWVFVFVLHQLVVMGLVLLRAGWFGYLAIVTENRH